MSESKEFHKFLSNVPSCKYVFKTGKVANFVGGVYLTSIKSEIEELTYEITEVGHPNFSIDKNEITVSSDKADPLAGIKKKAIEEYLAAQAAAINPDNDMGNTKKDSAAGVQTSRGVVGTVSSNSK